MTLDEAEFERVVPKPVSITAGQPLSRYDFSYWCHSGQCQHCRGFSQHQIMGDQHADNCACHCHKTTFRCKACNTANHAGCPGIDCNCDCH